jgi:murein DD-endopeptidase MepM/ murein hydrolase activator NlpD
MVHQVKNWWVRMAAALLAALSLMGIVIFNTPHTPGQGTGVSDDALLTAETSFTPLEIQALFIQHGSPLASYTEVVGEQTLSASELFWVAAQHADYGLSPKAMLTTLYLEDGWNWNQPDGLYVHLKQIALELERSYQDGLATAAAPGAKTAGLPQDSAATYALAHYYDPQANLATAKAAGQVRGSIQEWSAAYRKLFSQDPARPVTGKAIATDQPFLRLPFEDPAGSFVPVEAFFDHASPGQIEEPNMLRSDGKALPGAHYTGCWRAMTCYSGHNATDFTMPTGTPIYAAAAGQVVYRLDAEGGLILDHGNGYRTLYWHMDKIIVNWYQTVKDGELLGWSDNRGVSAHPHLHFGLRLSALSRDVDPFGWWSTAPDPAPGPSKFMWRGDLLADNGEPQTRLFYDQDWIHDTQGYGGGSWYTNSTNQAGTSTNWGMWGTYIATPGKYKVAAFWPKNAANTSAAVYQVWHAGGMTPVRVNQQSDGDRFVSLGTFDFNEGPIVVILTDLTPDGPKDQRVYFDAVKWEAARMPYYIPSIQSDGKTTFPTQPN